MKAAVIGCGRIGYTYPDNHCKAYNDLGIDVVLCDDKLDVDYWDYMEMMDKEHPDMVSVCTPPETHCKIVCDIAPYVKGVYCEKPIALTLKEASLMIRTCHKYNVILQINHQRRFEKPLFRFARGIFNTGTHVFDTINYYFKNPNMVEYEFIDSDEFIFDFHFRGNITAGIKHLIKCIKSGKQSVSSGEDGREALRKCLNFERKYVGR